VLHGGICERMHWPNRHYRGQLFRLVIFFLKQLILLRLLNVFIKFIKLLNILFKLVLFV
jgi:hypothetical protein